MSIQKEQYPNSEMSNDVEEKIKKIGEIDNALSQFLNFTTNEENIPIINSLLSFNSIIESDPDLSSKIENVEKSKEQKKKNGLDLSILQKSLEEKSKCNNQMRDDIANILSFLDNHESNLYI